MLTDNTGALKDALHVALSQCVSDLDEMLPSDVQDQIKGQNYQLHKHIVSKRPPDNSIYDTGKLHDSIQGVNNAREVNAASGGTYEAIVGTDVSYAVYVHEGGWHIQSIPPRPFLEDALKDHKDDYNDVIETAVGNAFRRFAGG